MKTLPLMSVVCDQGAFILARVEQCLAIIFWPRVFYLKERTKLQPQKKVCVDRLIVHIKP